MSSLDKNNISMLMKRLGSYLCPHFELHRLMITNNRTCCGSSHQFEYTPYCTLANQQCNGLDLCPRLNDKRLKALQDKMLENNKQKRIIKSTDIIIKDIK